MAGLNNISFIRGQGGLGRPLTGKDHISGLLFYCDTYPTGFSVGEPIKKISSLIDAVNLGINPNSIDETKATGGAVTVTGAGLESEIHSILWGGVVIGSFTQTATPTVNSAATGLAAAINANTKQHGFSATVATATVTLVLPTGFGRAGNGTNISYTSLTSTGAAGTGTATLVQATGGVGSVINVMHYQISEFFRMQPNGILYTGVYPVGTYTANEVTDIQNFANGEIKQIGIYLNGKAYASSQLTLTQTKITALRNVFKWLSTAIVGSDNTAGALATMSDLTTLNCQNVSYTIAQEGNFNIPAYSAATSYTVGQKATWGNGTYSCNQAGAGLACYNPQYWTKLLVNLKNTSGATTVTQSVPSVGAVLGTVALAKVNENIGWVGKFNATDGASLDEVGFTTGVLLSAQSDSLLNTLDDNGYIFLRKFNSKAGSYWNDSTSAISSTSDYFCIEQNRTIDKAEKNVYAAMLENLNSPLYVNKDGTLRSDTIAKFTNDCNSAIQQMEVDQEISGWKVTINPTQNVLTSSKIVITLVYLPTGVARNITINSGFTTKIA